MIFPFTRYLSTKSKTIARVKILDKIINRSKIYEAKSIVARDFFSNTNEEQQGTTSINQFTW